MVPFDAKEHSRCVTCATAAGEPLADFRARLAKLVAWLEARDERSIALTCHWGVIAALTGESFDNCEARRLPLSALRVREDVAY